MSQSESVFQIGMIRSFGLLDKLNVQIQLQNLFPELRTLTFIL